MIYIQSNKERTLPHHFDAACALYGAEDNALDFRLTSFEEVESGKFDMILRKNLFVGSVEFMREVFRRAGIGSFSLPRNSDRDCRVITLSEAKAIASGGTDIFIKPVQNKLFTGFVLDRMQYTSISGLPDDTPVMAYEPFRQRLESEWRVYVHNHKAVYWANYSGDFAVAPDYGFVKRVLESNMDRTDPFPVSYTADIGILANGENVVVEFNDMWAIGNYGIPNDMYFRLLKDRYFEIMKEASE